MAASSKLEEYCKPIAPLALGAGLITPGFKMVYPWIIHVRSAHYINNDEPEKYLQMALVSMLRLANDNDIRSLVIPAIGTGMFKFPAMLAARIICQVLNRSDELAPFLQTVRICLRDADMVQLFVSANAEVQSTTVG
jgi:O-acetyl-ADP-ribose deacetylase (regulator of RNase III)